jgi:proline iminopeptidase
MHVGVTGQGPDVVVLNGGQGCVQYLEHDELAPRRYRAWHPEPCGVGRSTGDPHSMEQTMIDLEAIRAVIGVVAWTALGHS